MKAEVSRQTYRGGFFFPDKQLYPERKDRKKENNEKKKKGKLSHFFARRTRVAIRPTSPKGEVSRRA